MRSQQKRKNIQRPIFCFHPFISLQPSSPAVAGYNAIQSLNQPSYYYNLCAKCHGMDHGKNRWERVSRVEKGANLSPGKMNSLWMTHYLPSDTPVATGRQAAVSCCEGSPLSSLLSLLYCAKSWSDPLSLQEEFLILSRYQLFYCSVYVVHLFTRVNGAGATGPMCGCRRPSLWSPPVSPPPHLVSQRSHLCADVTAGFLL